jgi:glycosyltransferase involved in cell wall biosynthesis
MTKLKIMINCGACQDFVAQCISSVRSQTLPEWEAYVTVDPCGDDTYARAVLAADGDRRIHVQQNTIRRYSMYNLIQAILRSDAGPEDVIVTLDGDDWFSGDCALRTIADQYEKYDCWLTYGSWLSNVEGPKGHWNGCWPAYPDGTTDFRRHRFLGTAVRTWKKWLWDHLRDADLRAESGEYVRVSEDQMIMIPLLEMAGTARARHIATPIMTYNKLVKYPANDAITEEGVRNGYLIDSRPPYRRLEGKLYTATATSGGAVGR